MSNATQNRAFRMALKTARQGAGYTLQDLADALGEGEDPVSVDTLTAWEAGKEAPREWDRPVVEAVEAALGDEGTLTAALGW
jgi:transcriptional regulator with XRE-family HTH domain